MPKRDDVPGLPARLKAVRETAGLNIGQAAEASGVHRVNIGVFETGTKTPTLATLYKLATAYGVNVCDLLPGGDRSDTPPPAQPSAGGEDVPEPSAGKKRRKK